MRMWKSDGQELPPPGPSERRQDFYNQQPTLFALERKDDAIVNLAILWNLDGGYDQHNGKQWCVGVGVAS